MEVGKGADSGGRGKTKGLEHGGGQTERLGVPRSEEEGQRAEHGEDEAKLNSPRLEEAGRSETGKRGAGTSRWSRTRLAPLSPAAVHGAAWPGQGSGTGVTLCGPGNQDGLE